MKENKLYQKSLQAIFAVLILGIAFFLRGEKILQKTGEAIKENNEIQNQANIINQFQTSSTTKENKNLLP